MYWYYVVVHGTDGVRMSKMIRADSPSIAKAMVIEDIPESKKDWVDRVIVKEWHPNGVAEEHYFGTP